MHHISSTTSKLQVFLHKKFVWLFYFLGGNMLSEQQARLNQDVKELEYYAAKLKKKGRFELMRKIEDKKEFLKNHCALVHNMKFAS